jgi:hypothetical protein
LGGSPCRPLHPQRCRRADRAQARRDLGREPKHEVGRRREHLCRRRSVGGHGEIGPVAARHLRDRCAGMPPCLDLAELLARVPGFTDFGVGAQKFYRPNRAPGGFLGFGARCRVVGWRSRRRQSVQRWQRIPAGSHSWQELYSCQGWTRRPGLPQVRCHSPC